MKNQFLIFVIGHNSSGKTFISKKIADSLKISRINNDLMRAFVIKNIHFYNNTTTSYLGKKIKSINKSVYKFSHSLIVELLGQKQSVLVDGLNIIKKDRSVYLQTFDKNVTRIIIETQIDEKDLLKRLKKRDVKSKDDRWVEFYKNNRKDLYNPIQDNEADHVLYYNQNNLAEIIKQLKKIIK